MSTIENPGGLDEYTIHDVLRNERRALTLAHLGRERRTTLRELAESIATVESGESPPPRNVRESVYNALHQTHLPKLDRLDVVTYERDRKLVERGPRARQFDCYLAAPTRGERWASYYRTLGAVSLAIVGLSAANVPVFASLPAAAWAGAFLCLLVLSAGYHRLERHRTALLPGDDGPTDVPTGRSLS